jgi:hypothetical protein
MKKGSTMSYKIDFYISYSLFDILDFGNKQITK